MSIIAFSGYYMADFVFVTRAQKAHFIMSRMNFDKENSDEWPAICQICPSEFMLYSIGLSCQVLWKTGFSE